MAALAQSTRRKLSLLHLAQELQKVYRPYLDKVTINSIASTEVAATPAWSIQFFEEDGRRPVEDFLDDLDNPRRAKVVAVVALLGEQGPNLPFPYSSQVRGKIRELRTQYGKDRYRVLYFGAPERIFVLLHAFQKNTAKVPESDIRIAENRMKKYVQQLENEGETRS